MMVLLHGDLHKRPKAQRIPKPHVQSRRMPIGLIWISFEDPSQHTAASGVDGYGQPAKQTILGGFLLTSKSIALC